jgi:hypothetical protein
MTSIGGFRCQNESGDQIAPTIPTKSAMIVNSGASHKWQSRAASPVSVWGRTQRAHGVDLLGDFHRAEFAGHPVELRPATMIAVSTGPSSRTSVRDTSMPVLPTCPY